MNVQWLRERWPAWAAGVVAWLAVAAGAAVYAGRSGAPIWPVAVTWAEWLVALGLLARLVVPIFRKSEVVSRQGRRVVGWLGDMTWALLVLFLLDLATRALLGLGWEPF
ncbi:MAG TPA: hypothetical protein VNT01_02245 [Symbiobacteriaceae bacterium]|nr:hypothetical protein [Symbiobacteriaceae bacterium]